MRYLFLRRRFLHRFDREAFRQRLTRHLNRWALPYLLLLAAAAWFQAHFTIALNTSPSLPHRCFLIEKGQRPERNQYVAFRWHGGGPYPQGVTFVKEVAGLPGDVITRTARTFFVNGIPVGDAKTLSRHGEPLALGPTGTLPAGHYYVRAPHPDSLDSRYQLTGWIVDDQIIGRAHALW